MIDRNPALKAKICPHCNKKGFRQYIATIFVRHYGVYCRECGYKSEPSVSENAVQPWVEAKENND